MRLLTVRQIVVLVLILMEESSERRVNTLWQTVPIEVDYRG